DVPFDVGSLAQFDPILRGEPSEYVAGDDDFARPDVGDDHRPRTDRELAPLDEHGPLDASADDDVLVRVQLAFDDDGRTDAGSLLHVEPSLMANLADGQVAFRVRSVSLPHPTRVVRPAVDTDSAWDHRIVRRRPLSQNFTVVVVRDAPARRPLRKPLQINDL